MNVLNFSTELFNVLMFLLLFFSFRFVLLFLDLFLSAKDANVNAEPKCQRVWNYYSIMRYSKQRVKYLKHNTLHTVGELTYFFPLIFD